MSVSRVEIQKVANGYLVRCAGDRLYVALGILEVAEVLEELFTPVAAPTEPEMVDAEPVTVDDLVRSGAVVRGVSSPAPTAEEPRGWPCADDGSEYPGVIHEASGRYVGKCPSCGDHTAEYRGNLLRCTGKPGGKPCRTSWPRDVVERLIALAGADA